MLRSLLPLPGAGETRLRFVVRLVVAVLCVGALLQAMRPAVFSARQGVTLVHSVGAHSAANAAREQLEYIGTELHRQVAAGTRVVVVDSDQSWRYHVIELATLQGLVVVDSGAEVQVGLRFDRAAPHGVVVLVQRVAG